MAPTREYGATRWIILAIVTAALFLGTFDLWVVTIALPSLQHEFAPASLSDIAWILNVYTIVLATVLAPAGRIADGVGRKNAFVVGVALFGIASLGCALSPSLIAMIAWRSLQAFGAAIVLPTSLGLALSAFPSHERATAIGVWAAVGATAAGSGPVIGGLLVEWSWRWIFLVNAPIVVATVLAGIAILPGGDTPGARLRIDARGMLLVLGAMGLVCGGLVEAAVWPPLVIGPMLGAGLLCGVGIVLHARRHADAVIPARLFSTVRYRMSALGMVAYYLGFSVMLLGSTLYLTNGLHLSVLQAAIGLTPGPISAGLASPFSGRITARIGARRTLLAGAALFGLAALWPLSLSVVLEAPTYLGSVLPSLILWGMANACIQPTLFGGADAVARDDLAVATGVLSAARQLGSALGVALLVGLLGSVAGGANAGIEYAWGIVVVSAALTAVTSLRGAAAG